MGYHHIVPRFYLNGFATDRKDIGRVDLHTKRRKVQPTKSVGGVANFNALPDIEDPNLFDREILGRQVEDRAARIFRRVLGDKKWPLHPADREHLATFLALQNLRGQSTRNHISQFATIYARLDVAAGGRAGLAARYQQASGEDLAEEELEELWSHIVEPDSLDLQAGPALHLRRVLDLLPQIVKYFLFRPWMLVRFERRTLITCDTPISLMPHPDDEPFMGVGLQTAWGMIYPMSRSTGLILADPMVLAEGGIPPDFVASGRADQTLPPSSRLASTFNRLTISNAREWVFYHPDDVALIPDDLPDPLTDEIDVEGAEGLVQALAARDGAAGIFTVDRSGTDRR